MHRFLTLSAAALCLLIPMDASASKDTPVIIEFFSAITCRSDEEMQKSLRNTLAEYPGALLINCRTGINQPGQAEPSREQYMLEFCADKAVSYFDKFGFMAARSPLVIINGRYDANPREISVALDMAQSLDGVKPITLARQDQNLTLSIPGADSPDVRGRIYLYTMLSSHRVKTADAPAQPAPDSPKLPQSEPFQSTTPGFNDFYLRPVVKVEDLGSWDGTAQTVTHRIPLENPFKQNQRDLNYLVMITKGAASTGDVLAAGQLLSAKEEAAKLSKPTNAPE
jgi:hypothetical protein